MNQTVVFASFSCFAKALQWSWKLVALAPATAVLSRSALATLDLVSCIVTSWLNCVRRMRADEGKYEEKGTYLSIATCMKWACTVARTLCEVGGGLRVGSRGCRPHVDTVD